MQLHRRALVAALATGLVLSFVPGQASATLAARERRLAGENRYVTAQVVATTTFETASVAVLASGQSFGDALAASYLAGGFNAPILLTDPKELSPGVIDALRAMETQQVVVVGGEAAVAEGILDELRDTGFGTSRQAGPNRYETSATIARAFASSTIGQLDGVRGAIVATGESFADALAVAPLSASQGLPILLTTTASLHAAAREALVDLQIERVLVVGGPVAVSTQVQAEIEALGVSVRREAGATRQATSIRIATIAATEMGYAIDRVLLARGDTFADALAAGGRGGLLKAPVLLVQSRDVLGTELRDHLKANVDTITSVDVLGGTGVISQPVADDAVAAAQGR